MARTSASQAEKVGSTPAGVTIGTSCAEMGPGTAWGGHLTCNEDISWVRCPVAPPKRRIQQLYLIVNLAHMVEHQSVKLTVVGSSPTFYLMRLDNN